MSANILVKKILAVVMAAVLLVPAFSGCDNSSESLEKVQSRIRADMDASKTAAFYQSLGAGDKELYTKVCAAIEEHKTTEILIGTYDTAEERTAAVNEFQMLYRMLVYEHPEYFWVDPYTQNFTTRDLTTSYNLYLTISYIIDREEADSKKDAFNEKVDYIVNEAGKRENLFDQVLYVYDYIATNTSYDYALAASEDTTGLGRSAYGCLVDGNTICSGYSLAFNLIMQRLGIESGVEFNTYGPISVIEGHVWNYCKLDNEYYYFDLTWDDTGFDSSEYSEYLSHSHCYFAITGDELASSHFIASEATTPECTGTKYNYFIQKGYDIPTYDYKLVQAAIEAQSGNRFVELRFGSYSELLAAEYELMEQGKIHNLLSGKTNISYSIAKSNVHMYIFFD